MRIPGTWRNRTTLVFGLLLSMFCSSCSTSETSNAQERPNIIFIIVDDSEFIEYGCYGGHVLTPNIDRIAETGVLFTRGFTSTSVCTPTRYTVLTGKYASRAASLRTIGKQPPDLSSFVSWNTVLEKGEYNIASRNARVS